MYLRSQILTLSDGKEIIDSVMNNDVSYLNNR